MLSLSPTLRIFLCRDRIDCRKSFDGLAALVTQALGHDPLSGHWFVFRNRKGDRLKILAWQEDGWAIWYKKQEEECPHSFAFTEFGELAHNLALRLAGVAAVDADSPAGDSRRSPMSPVATASVPPRAHRHRCSSINFGIG
jgi:hypothetical protein